jgi:hypothetical protein
MVVGGRLGRFRKKRTQIFGLYHTEVIYERKEPADVPAPSATFNRKRDVVFAPLFAEDLEWSFFPDPLGRNRIDLDRTFDPFLLIIPSSKEISERKAIMSGKLLEQRCDCLDSIGPEVAIILPNPAPSDQVPAIPVIG